MSIPAYKCARCGSTDLEFSATVKRAESEANQIVPKWDAVMVWTDRANCLACEDDVQVVRG